jgi:hypothetical protein
MTAQEIADKIVNLFPSLDIEATPTGDENDRFLYHRYRVRTLIRIGDKKFGRILSFDEDIMLDHPEQIDCTIKRIVEQYLKIVEKEIGEGFDIEVYREQDRYPARTDEQVYWDVMHYGD